MANRKKRILIVDDDPDFVEALSIVLKRHYDVIAASDGQEGLTKAHEESPHLIILDVMMTRIGEGFDVCRTLKKDPATAHIPIIMFTAISKQMGLDFKTSAGDDDWLPVDEYLDKPVEPAVLLERVKKLLKR